jgi:hypothetical protein
MPSYPKNAIPNVSNFQIQILQTGVAKRKFKMRKMLGVCLSVGMFYPSLAWTAEGVMSDVEFYRLTTNIMNYPWRHDQMIDDCATKGLQIVDEPTLSKLSKSSGMPAERAIHEICRRLVRGIAAGKITYTTYLKWMEKDPFGAIKLPDYQ